MSRKKTALTCTGGKGGTVKLTRAIEQYIGDRLRTRRIQLGLTQTALGAKVGLTFQQIQKYERGSNRIGSGLLLVFAGMLGVEVGYFTEGLDPQALPVELKKPTRPSRRLLEIAHVAEKLSTRSQLIFLLLGKVLTANDADLKRLLGLQKGSGRKQKIADLRAVAADFGISYGSGGHDSLGREVRP